MIGVGMRLSEEGASKGGEGKFLDPKGRATGEENSRGPITSSGKGKRE